MYINLDVTSMDYLYLEEDWPYALLVLFSALQFLFIIGHFTLLLILPYLICIITSMKAVL